MLRRPIYNVKPRYLLAAFSDRLSVKLFLYTAVAAAVLAVPAAALAHDAARPRTAPLPANAMFGGSVNGASTHATLRVACFGPVHPGQTGHLMAYQRVGVFIPEVMKQPNFGQTGSPAFAIGVSIVAGGHTVGPVTWFRRLALTRPVRSASRPLPSGVPVPCSGHGTVVFTPVPRTANAKPATVDVTFVGQP